MRVKTHAAPVTAALLVAAVVPSLGGEARQPEPTLAGRAVLAAGSVADGPPSGTFFAGQTINGITFPRPGQAVIGFSGIVAGRTPGEVLAVADNGFGNKANSRDFLIRAYYLTPDFETRSGGSGTVAYDGDAGSGGYVEFSDPQDLLDFPIVNEGTPDRLLTGADIDPESLQRGHDGDLWVGDEFGPWILHFNADGELVDRPFSPPGDLVAETNPLRGAKPVTVRNSRGFEAMSMSPNGRFLYGVLEGAVIPDETTSPRVRRMFEFDVHAEEFTARTWNHVVDAATPLVADMNALDRHRMVLIERDALNPGVTRSVQAVDLRDVGDDGSLTKRAVVDLAAIRDPHLISLPLTHPDDIGLGDPYRVTCESIEAVHVLSASRLMLGCDNNLPNTGRNPTRADDSEFIVVKVPGLKSSP